MRYPSPLDKLTKERFLKKIQKTEYCWLWLGAKDTLGYGFFGWQKQTIRAHRLAYLYAIGPLQDGLFVCHKCDNPSCVNPAHLFLGTPKDNTRDSYMKGRQSPHFGQPGERSICSRLKNEDILEIRAMCSRGVPHSEIALKFGIARATVSNIKSRNRWSHL